MVHTHAARLFNKAAAEKDAEVIKIIAAATKVPAPLIAKAAPRWTWYNDDGLPNVDSVMAAVQIRDAIHETRHRQSNARHAVRSRGGQRSDGTVEDCQPVHVSHKRMEPGVAIECDGVCLTYSTKSGAPVEALQHVSFRIEPRRVTAIIGPSGCGKSTLLLTIRGLMAPTSGRCGLSMLETGAKAAEPRMATVWQELQSVSMAYRHR